MPAKLHSGRLRRVAITEHKPNAGPRAAAINGIAKPYWSRSSRSTLPPAAESAINRSPRRLRAARSYGESPSAQIGLYHQRNVPRLTAQRGPTVVAPNSRQQIESK
jgi:hypothetical protein